MTSKLEEMLSRVLKKVKNTESNMQQLCNDIATMGQVVNSHATSIKHIHTQLSQMSIEINQR